LLDSSKLQQDCRQFVSKLVKRAETIAMSAEAFAGTLTDL
jgi:hypothetical protein